MNKKDLENIVENELKKHEGPMKMGCLQELINKMFEEEEEVIYSGMWIFQEKDLNNEDLDFKNVDEAVSYFIENLDNYFNLYLEFEGNIEPAGCADVYISFTLDEESRKKYIRILNIIKDNKLEINEYTEYKEILDTIPIMHFFFTIADLTLENIKVA